MDIGYIDDGPLGLRTGILRMGCFGEVWKCRMVENGVLEGLRCYCALLTECTSMGWYHARRVILMEDGISCTTL